MIDFGALFSQLLTAYWWAIPLLIFVVLFKSPWFKGVMGEAMVNLAASLFLDKNEYHLIKNVTIPTADDCEMVLRTSKKGPNASNQFWGCSAFPKCRTIEAME